MRKESTFLSEEEQEVLKRNMDRREVMLKMLFPTEVIDGEEHTLSPDIKNMRVAKEQCRVCGTWNYNEDIIADKRKKSYRGICKNCIRVNYREKEYTMKRLYKSQCLRSVIRKHPQPEYSYEWFCNYLKHDTDFDILYDMWALSNYRKSLSPSIDRLDNSLHYTKNNIQLVTWGENDVKGREEKKTPVNSYTLQGDFLQSYESITSAEVATGAKNISLVVNRKRNKSGGLIFTFHGDEQTLHVLIDANKNKQANNIRGVYQYTLDGEFIGEFSSIHEAVTKLKIRKVGEVCRGTQKSAQGYAFSFIKEKEGDKK